MTMAMIRWLNKANTPKYIIWALVVVGGAVAIYYIVAALAFFALIKIISGMAV